MQKTFKYFCIILFISFGKIAKALIDLKDITRNLYKLKRVRKIIRYFILFYANVIKSKYNINFREILLLQD
jgi:hypothetical protein